MITVMDDKRLSHVKTAFSVRNVPLGMIRAIDASPRKPSAGDVVLARVIEPGRLEKLERPGGRKSALYEGDEVLVVYGNRYAPDAYEALIPEDLGPCDLAAAGGLASRIVETNLLFAKPEDIPTRLQPLGLCVCDQGKVLNVKDFAVRPASVGDRHTPVICVFGASMNAGKTTTVAGVVRGLTQQGMRVGALKVTGTCAGGDLWKFLDAGAVAALDFTDGGFATTYLENLKDIRTSARNLIGKLEEAGCDVIVMEIADGLHQKETAALLQDMAFRTLVDHWMFAADNAASIIVGMSIAAHNFGLDIRAVSGIVTASPLALREAAALTSAPMLGLDALEEGNVTAQWLADPNLSPFLNLRAPRLAS